MLDPQKYNGDTPGATFEDMIRTYRHTDEQFHSGGVCANARAHLEDLGFHCTNEIFNFFPAVAHTESVSLRKRYWSEPHGRKHLRNATPRSRNCRSKHNILNSAKTSTQRQDGPNSRKNCQIWYGSGVRCVACSGVSEHCAVVDSVCALAVDAIHGRAYSDAPSGRTRPSEGNLSTGKPPTERTT